LLFLYPIAFSKLISLYITIINMHTLRRSSTYHTYLHLIIQKHIAHGGMEQRSFTCGKFPPLSRILASSEISHNFALAHTGLFHKNEVQFC
jgi:hypothetical protein